MLTGKLKGKYISASPQTVPKHTEEGQKLLSVLEKLQTIEDKNKCLRVQFLDWLSDKLLDWSNDIHEISVRIDTPCVIKVEPRTKQESKSAKENKEIVRLKELLKKEQERNNANSI